MYLYYTVFFGKSHEVGEIFLEKCGKDICWIIEKAREFWKNIYFCSIDYAKAFDCVDHNEL